MGLSKYSEDLSFNAMYVGVILLDPEACRVIHSAFREKRHPKSPGFEKHEQLNILLDSLFYATEELQKWIVPVIPTHTRTRPLFVNAMHLMLLQSGRDRVRKSLPPFFAPLMRLLAVSLSLIFQRRASPMMLQVARTSPWGENAIDMIRCTPVLLTA